MTIARQTRAITPPPRQLLLVVVAIWLVWGSWMTLHHTWGLYAKEGFMAVTMVFGSFIAGATAEGGGAVAFPVMTLLFHIAPATARDFSLMIQSVGMTTAALSIFLLRIPVELRAIVIAGAGGALGIIFSLTYIAPAIPPVYAKLFFTSFWLSFIAALYWVNRDNERSVATRLPPLGGLGGITLLGVGMLGGMVSGIIGTGLDITVFSLLVLRFRICERIATPTSVVLMASNSLVGFFWQGAVLDAIAPKAWEFWWVCIPVVVVGAPLGAWLVQYLSRHRIRHLLYASIVAQYLLALFILPLTPALYLFSGVVVLSGVIFFAWMERSGGSLFRRTPQPETT